MKDGRVWFVVAMACFLLSTYLPIKIKDPVLRKRVNRYFLVPVCLIIMFYVYPIGIEFFKRLALNFH